MFLGVTLFHLLNPAPSAPPSCWWNLIPELATSMPPGPHSGILPVLVVQLWVKPPHFLGIPVVTAATHPVGSLRAGTAASPVASPAGSLRGSPPWPGAAHGGGAGSGAAGAGNNRAMEPPPEATPKQCPPAVAT